MSRVPQFKKARGFLDDISSDYWKTLEKLIKTDMPKKILELDKMWKSWSSTKDYILHSDAAGQGSLLCVVRNNKRPKLSSSESTRSEESTVGTSKNSDSALVEKVVPSERPSNVSSKSINESRDLKRTCENLSQVYEERDSPEGEGGLSKKRKMTDVEEADKMQEFPYEKKIMELNKTLRLEITDIVNHLDQLRMCICLARPKFLDGHNFGAKVQLQVRRILQGGISASMTYLETISNNHMLSAKIQEKIKKYPNVEDYRIALREQCSKVLLNQVYCLRALRDTYTVCHDTVVKNIERLKFPRPGGDSWMVS